MDTRLDADQAELFATVQRVVRDHGPTTVADLDAEGGEATPGRRARLAAAIEATGVRELRDDGGDGSPLASGVELCLVAEALGEGVADVAFVGPVLARDLLRRCGADARDDVTVAVRADGARLAGTGDEARAIDASGATVALRRGTDDTVVVVDVTTPRRCTDLTRHLAEVAADGTEIGSVAPADLARWQALGLAMTASDAVGAMRGGVRLAVDYARERQQYDTRIGAFQAVQHLLAEAHTLVEGSLSIARHAAWAVDALDPADALAAARAAAAYTGRASRTVGETVIQVHGGIGNTWECMAHVFHRRAIHDNSLLGDDRAQLEALAATRTGGSDGLS